MGARFALQPGKIRVRHIRKGDGSQNGSVTLLGASYYPADGVNGSRGFTSGSYDRRLYEEGTFTLRFPNAAGEDGVLHRRRFAVKTDPNYRPGDEFIEIYEDDHQLVFVGTPTAYQIDRGTFEITGVDAMWLLRHARETAVGFWHHAPRDVFEHYTRVWRVTTAEDFDQGVVFTDSGSQQTSSDGKWIYRYGSSSAGQPPGSAVRLHQNPVFGAEYYSYLLSTDQITVGVGNPDAAWRLEATLRNPDPIGNPTIRPFVGLWFDIPSDAEVGDARGVVVSTDYVGLEFDPVGGAVENVGYNSSLRGVGHATQPVDGIYHLALELRDGWAYGFFNGALVGVLRLPVVPGWLEVLNSSTARHGVVTGRQRVDVDSITFRQLNDYLHVPLDPPGDRRLAGAPTRGGLDGSYFDGLRTTQFHNVPLLEPSPIAEPRVRKIDSTIDMTAASSGQRAPWLPAEFPGVPSGGTQQSGFAVRWTGSIYLDLANFDYRLRVTVQDWVTVWVGKTRISEPAIAYSGAGVTSTLTSSQMRAFLASTVSGWYPIVIEFVHVGPEQQPPSTPINGDCRFQLTADRSDAQGTFQVVNSTSTPREPYLSPFGCHVAEARFESHYEMLAQLKETWALQFTCEPRQLESGHFPGILIPRVREGRDTDYKLESSDAISPGVQGNAEDCVDFISADARGLADPEQTAQVSADKFDFSAVDDHFMLHQEYESLGDISDQSLLEQRLESMLALRGSPWEELTVQPGTRKELRDTFPVTGAAAEFRWAPGDGIRVDLPELDVQDLTPRQILGVGFDFAPDGISLPKASFRQRPRSLREFIRRVHRNALTNSRNFQGQLVTLLGNVAQAPFGDQFSRVVLPTNAANIVSGWLVVLGKDDDTTEFDFYSSQGGPSPASIGFIVTRPGRYPIPVGRDGTNPRAYVATNAETVSAITFQLELRVRLL